MTKTKSTNLSATENEILRNRGNAGVIDNIIAELYETKKTLDWQIDQFLTKYCQGVLGLEKTDLDTSNPIYRYYNHKCGEYSAVERLIRVAKAYRGSNV